MTLGAPAFWLGVSAALCVALWLLALGYERRRGSAPWRWVAVTAAVLCLFLLAAEPSRQQRLREATALVVASGADPVAAARWAATSEAFALPGAPELALPRIAAVSVLALERPEIRHWQIAGRGLPAWDLEDLSGAIEFTLPAAPESGIDRVAWRRSLPLGQPLVVNGQVTAIGGGAKVRLTGPGGPEDETEIVDGSFTLRTVPRQVGRHLYRLVVEEAGRESVRETLDVAVVDHDPPRVLWLEGAPSFETRHVKEWLRRLGGAMVVRSRVSRGRHRYEFLNHERIDVSRLGPELLDDFDVVVVDGLGWAALSRADRATLREGVGAGLGLLLLPSEQSVPADEELFRAFAVGSIDDLESIEARLAGPALAQLPALTISARELEGDPERRGLVQDTAGRVLAATAPYGGGLVGLSLVTETYRWALRGESEAHARYWARLLEALGRPAGRDVEWLIADRPVLADDPFEIELIAEGPDVSLTDPRGRVARVAMEQDRFDSRRWRAVWSPTREGWHRLATGGTATDFYVQKQGTWRSWRQRQAILATERRALLGPGVERDGAEPVIRLRPIPPVWFFAGFLLALSSLWADEQWRSGDSPRAKPASS